MHPAYFARKIASLSSVFSQWRIHEIEKDYETEDRQTQFLGRDDAENDQPTLPSHRSGVALVSRLKD